MSIKNSYDGAISRQASTDLLSHEISKCLLRGPFPSDPEAPSICYVTDTHVDIDSFVHPYWRNEDDCVYIDTRGFSTVNAAGIQTVRQGEDYDMWVYRAKLELAWIRGDRKELFTAYQFANEVFVRWLTSVIKDKYRLSPIHESRLLCCVALFNIGRYFNHIDGFRMVEKYVQQIVSTYRIDANMAMEIAGLCGDVFPRNVDEFIALVKAANVSPSLVDLNRLTLFNSLNGSFFMVSNSPAIVSLAIEYPPAYVAMVLMVFRHSTIKNKTLIGKRTDMMCVGGRDRVFLRAVELTINRYIDDVMPNRTLGNESRVGHEGVGTVVAAAAGGCIFLAFLAWLIGEVFGSEKSPSNSSKKAVEELTKAVGDMKASSDLVNAAFEAIKSDAWPGDDVIEKLDEDGKKIWADLSAGVRLPGIKMAVYNFAKSKGKSSVISMGPVKYEGGDVSKFKTNLGKANTWLATTFAGKDGDQISQAVISALLANRPFPLVNVANPESVDKLATGFDKAREIMEKISNATSSDELTPVAAEIHSYNSEIQTLFKNSTDSKESEVSNIQGTGGLVTATKASRNINMQLFIPSTGEFNEAFLKEHSAMIVKIVETHSNVDKAMELAKLNAEACTKLEGVAKTHESSMKKYSNIKTKLNEMPEDQQQTDAFKTALQFVSGKNELMAYTTDILNCCKNTATSLQALAKVIGSMTIDLSSKAMFSGDGEGDAAKKEGEGTEKPAETEKPKDNATGETK